MAHLIYLMAELEWDGWFGIDTLLLNINLAGIEYCLYDVREFPQNNNAKISPSFVNHALGCPLLWTLR